MFTATAMALMSYGAWSVIPSMGTAFRNPSRDIPLSMLLSLISCGVIFGLFVLVMNGMATPEMLGSSATPSADAFLLHSRYGALIIAVGGIFACVSSSNSHVMTSSRIPYKMSRDGFLPKGLSHVNKNGIPTYAILFMMVCQIVVAATGTINLLVQMIVFVTSVSWLITLICSVILRRKISGYPSAVSYAGVSRDPDTGICSSCFYDDALYRAGNDNRKYMDRSGGRHLSGVYENRPEKVL